MTEGSANVSADSSTATAEEVKAKSKRTRSKPNKGNGVVENGGISNVVVETFPPSNTSQNNENSDSNIVKEVGNTETISEETKKNNDVDKAGVVVDNAPVAKVLPGRGWEIKGEEKKIVVVEAIKEVRSYCFIVVCVFLLG